MVKLPCVKRHILHIHRHDFFPLWLFRIVSLAGHLCHLVVKIQISWCKIKEYGCGGKTIKFPQAYVGFQCRMTLPQCIVFCGFKHPSDNMRSYRFSDCYLFSLVILLETGQERELAKIVTESLCRL